MVQVEVPVYSPLMSMRMVTFEVEPLDQWMTPEPVPFPGPRAQSIAPYLIATPLIVAPVMPWPLRSVQPVTRVALSSTKVCAAFATMSPGEKVIGATTDAQVMLEGLGAAVGGGGVAGAVGDGSVARGAGVGAGVGAGLGLGAGADGGLTPVDERPVSVLGCSPTTMPEFALLEELATGDSSPSSWASTGTTPTGGGVLGSATLASSVGVGDELAVSVELVPLSATAAFTATGAFSG